MRFEDCGGNEAVVFQSSDPDFGVRRDGSVFAQVDGASLQEPVQFKLTAHGPGTRTWETVVQLALVDPPSPQQSENEASHTLTALKRQAQTPPITSSPAVRVTAGNQVRAPLGL